MQAMHTSVILAILCTSCVWVSGLQSPKSKGQDSETKAAQSLSEGTQCGVSANAPDLIRVAGGDEAKPHSWPWQVYTECILPEDNTVDVYHFVCGGSIISNKWIISAAHCALDARLPREVVKINCRIVLGEHDLRRNESTQLTAKIADYYTHPDFVQDKPRGGNDLALFKLAKPLKFTDAIQPICLPFGLSELPTNKTCYTTGWGRTIYNVLKTSDRLMQLPMMVTNDKYCRSQYPKNYPAICAVRKDDNSDACYGDSGGPLACQERNQKWHLRGVVSQGIAKCDIRTTFTKVTLFEKWIKDVMSRK